MLTESTLIQEATPVVWITADNMDRHPEVMVVATRDHEVVRRWATQRKAEPATGEHTSSGQATVHVSDGGAGIRFNFPAVGRFRPISWDEWFENFETHELVFVYERDTSGMTSSNRYRLVKMDVLHGLTLL